MLDSGSYKLYFDKTTDQTDIESFIKSFSGIYEKIF